ncbi:hypothetical protein BS47DRAFT_1483957 [Hydnum rufescens UP504]|uniref:Uncharacterized protein n=1 Tax=Hydnum rufescens UP504 TaxID=1448309 RepID=A0A9P6DWJ8_9AGAM|nr:hypothetical protein BS47DRAFT_1483957 [Hydnum rufescens UP504]
MAETIQYDIPTGRQPPLASVRPCQHSSIQLPHHFVPSLSKQEALRRLPCIAFMGFGPRTLGLGHELNICVDPLFSGGTALRARGKPQHSAGSPSSFRLPLSKIFPFLPSLEEFIGALLYLLAMNHTNNPDDWDASLKNSFALRPGTLLIAEVAAAFFILRCSNRTSPVHPTYIIEAIPPTVTRFLNQIPGKKPAHGWLIFTAILFQLGGPLNVFLWLVTGRRFGFSSQARDDPEDRGAHSRPMGPYSRAVGDLNSAHPIFPDGTSVARSVSL